MDIFAGDFTDGITEGFKTADLYGDVTTSPFNMSTESSRDSKRNFRTVTCLFTVRMADRIIERIILSVNPSVKVNICPLCQLCSSSFQSQLSPTANNQPKKKISLFSAQQIIFLEVLWLQHSYSDLSTDFISFCK